MSVFLFAPVRFRFISAIHVRQEKVKPNAGRETASGSIFWFRPKGLSLTVGVKDGAHRTDAQPFH